MVRQIADAFLREARKPIGINLVSQKYQLEQFAGDECQGTYAAFQVTNGHTNSLQVVFMMSVEGKIWNGQFTGRSDAWRQSIDVLKSARKKD